METVLDTATVRCMLGSGSNGAVLSATFNGGGSRVDDDSSNADNAEAADQIPSNRQVALKVMSHFWDSNAKKLLDCERRTLHYLPVHPSVIRVFREFTSEVPQHIRAHLTQEMQTALQSTSTLANSSPRPGSPSKSPRTHTTQYFIMEYHPTTLDSWRFVWPIPLPWHVLWRVSVDLVAVVAHMQRNGVAHLDLKLDNVLIGYDGRCILTDFGISRIFGKGSDMSLQYKEPFGLLMNRLVLSPEVLQAYDRAKDTWKRYSKAREGNSAAAATPVGPAQASAASSSTAASASSPSSISTRSVPLPSAPGFEDARQLQQDLSINFGAQGIWSIGVILYELACAFVHEPTYPDDGGGMRNTWYALRNLPPIPISKSSLRDNSGGNGSRSLKPISSSIAPPRRPSSKTEVTGSSLRVRASATINIQTETTTDASPRPSTGLLRAPDGSFRHAHANGYPAAYCGLVMSMLDSDPNRRIDVETALAVLERLAPRYTRVHSEVDDSSLPSTAPPTPAELHAGHNATVGLVEMMQSFTPAAPERGRVRMPDGSQYAFNNQSDAGVEVGSDGTTVMLRSDELTDDGAATTSNPTNQELFDNSTDALEKGAIKTLTPLIPVLLRHWSGHCRLVRVTPNVTVEQLVACWTVGTAFKAETGASSSSPQSLLHAHPPKVNSARSISHGGDLDVTIEAVVDDDANDNDNSLDAAGAQADTPLDQSLDNLDSGRADNNGRSDYDLLAHVGQQDGNPQPDDEAVSSSRAFLGGYECGNTEPVEALVRHLCPVDCSIGSHAVQRHDNEDDAWSDEENSTNDAAQNAANGAAEKQPAITVAEVQAALVRTGGLMILDLVPPEGEAVCLNAAHHMSLLEDVCAGIPRSGADAGPFSARVVPHPLVVVGNDDLHPLMQQPQELAPCIHVDGQAATASASSSSLSGGEHERSTSDPASVASPSSAANAGLAVVKRGEASPALMSSDVATKAELALQWFQSYAQSDRVHAAPPMQQQKAGSPPFDFKSRVITVDMREGMLYRCLLALTGLSNTALKDSTSPFPYVDCARFAVRAIRWYPLRHETVAAAAGLLRNVSCTEDQAQAAAMIQVGSLDACVAGYFAAWRRHSDVDAEMGWGVPSNQEAKDSGGSGGSGGHRRQSHVSRRRQSGASKSTRRPSGATSGRHHNKFHGHDPRAAEDCVLAASNLLRFEELQHQNSARSASGTSSTSGDENQGPYSVPAFDIARMAVDAMTRPGPDADKATQQSMHTSASRLMRYLLNGDSGKGGSSCSLSAKGKDEPAAIAIARAGGLKALSITLSRFHADNGVVETALHVMCSLLVHAENRKAAMCPYKDCAEAVVGVLSLPEYSSDMAILGLGATVLRNLACVTAEDAGPMNKGVVGDDVSAATGDGHHHASHSRSTPTSTSSPRDGYLTSAHAGADTTAGNINSRTSRSNSKSTPTPRLFASQGSNRDVLSTAPAATAVPQLPIQPQVTMTPALVVTQAGAATVLEDIMSRHPNDAIIQENGRCALYNLLLIGANDTKEIIDRAAAVDRENEQLRQKLRAMALVHAVRSGPERPLESPRRPGHLSPARSRGSSANAINAAVDHSAAVNTSVSNPALPSHTNDSHSIADGTVVSGHAASGPGLNLGPHGDHAPGAINSAVSGASSRLNSSRSSRSLSSRLLPIAEPSTTTGTGAAKGVGAHEHDEDDMPADDDGDDDAEDGDDVGALASAGSTATAASASGTGAGRLRVPVPLGRTRAAIMSDSIRSVTSEFGAEFDEQIHGISLDDVRIAVPIMHNMATSASARTVGDAASPQSSRGRADLDAESSTIIAVSPAPLDGGDDGDDKRAYADVDSRVSTVDATGAQTPANADSRSPADSGVGSSAEAIAESAESATSGAPVVVVSGAGARLGAANWSAQGARAPSNYGTAAAGRSPQQQIRVPVASLAIEMEAGRAHSALGSTIDWSTGLHGQQQNKAPVGWCGSRGRCARQLTFAFWAVLLLLLGAIGAAVAGFLT